MPTPEARMDTDGAAQWRLTPPQLPSFYSPVAGPLDESANSDVDRDLSLAPVPSEAPSQASSSQAFLPPLPSLLSPAFTPPSTPGAGTLTPATSTAATPAPRGVPVDSTSDSGGCGTRKPRLLETLPVVQCIVRARIPNNLTQTEMWLHVYTNNVDSKEHLAIVFGRHIRSTSLDVPQPGETEWDRMARGAYSGRLYPGRTSSGLLQGSPMQAMPGSDGAEPRAETTTAAAATYEPPLVRVHSECYTGETVWSARCDCGEQLDEAARLMALAENAENPAGGIIIYLRQEGRGIGLSEKLKAYNLQDLGSDTVEANLLLRHPADARSYGLATAMLLDLRQRDVRLLTNNPDKIRAVEGPNREIVVKERVPMVPLSWRGQRGVRGAEFENYLKTKIDKMGHMLPRELLPRSGS